MKLELMQSGEYVHMDNNCLGTVMHIWEGFSCLECCATANADTTEITESGYVG